MTRTLLVLSLSLLPVRAASADGGLDQLKRDVEALKKRVTTLEEDNAMPANKWPASMDRRRTVAHNPSRISRR